MPSRSLDELRATPEGMRDRIGADQHPVAGPGVAAGSSHHRVGERSGVLADDRRQVCGGVPHDDQLVVGELGCGHRAPGRVRDETSRWGSSADRQTRRGRPSCGLIVRPPRPTTAISRREHGPAGHQHRHPRPAPCDDERQADLVGDRALLIA